MKFTLALLSLGSATAFLPAMIRPRSTALLLSSSVPRTDASAAIADAIAASQRYGAASPQARVAWDIVEEIDAGDNSAAYETPSLADNCLTEEEISKACLDYADKLEELQSYVKDVAPKMAELHQLATHVQRIQLATQPATPAPDSPQIRAALQFARDQVAQYGADSPEARVAWTELEDIASAGLANAMGGRLDEECLVDSALSACEALEELNRVLSLPRES